MYRIGLALAVAVSLAACGSRGASSASTGSGTGAAGAAAGTGTTGSAGSGATSGATSATGSAGSTGSSGSSGSSGSAGATGTIAGAPDAGAVRTVGPGSTNATYTCARELHVAITGSDAGDGKPATPFRTIAKVTQMAQAGDCVLVHAGTYAEGSTIQFNADGTASSPIVLRSADGLLAAVIDATTNRTGETVLIRHDYVVVDGFEFKNSPLDTQQQVVHFDGQLTGKGRGSVLRNSKLTAGYDTIKVNQASESVTIESNEIYGPFTHLPVSLTGANGIVFRNNDCHDWTLNGDGAVQYKGGSHDGLFQANRFENVNTSAGTITLGDGCDATCDIDPQHYAAVRARAIDNVFVHVGRGFDVQGCEDCAVLSNTIVASGQNNVIFKLTSATTNGTTTNTVNARILDNLISNPTGDGNKVIQVNAGADVGLSMDYNLAWNGGAAISWGDGHPVGADAHSVTLDPKLTSATDFTLRAGSPAIGAGTNLIADVPVDFVGAPRPATGPFDIGAYQTH